MDAHAGGRTPDSASPSAMAVALPFDASGCVHPGVETRCTAGWCEIPAGCFVMGSPEDEWGRGPAIERRTAVTLTRSFAIQETEVTQAAWTDAGLPNPSGKMPDGSGDCTELRCPVGNVTWFEAAAFANLLSQRHDPPLPACYVLTGCSGKLGAGMTCSGASSSESSVYDCQGYRLPTDAEWEYAARGGTRTAFYSGSIARAGSIGDCRQEPDLSRIAWYCHNSGGMTHPVAELEPNGFGIRDTSGNASEWVNDVANGGPPTRPLDPGGVVGPSIPRILRGGSFNGYPILCRSADHGAGSWNARAPGVGFRLARTLGE